MALITFEQAVAALPDGRFEGGRYRARCPAHGGQDRNLAVWADENGAARFKCWSHGCPAREIAAAFGSPRAAANGAPRAAQAAPAEQKMNRDRALEIWRETSGPRGTICHDYLFGRGWTGLMPVPNCVGADPGELARAGIGIGIPAALRFAPALKHPSGAYLPAMVAAIENRNGEIVGIHRTYLNPDGTGKADVEPQKMALGRLRGCAVHLTAGAPELVLCEGIETGLSILQATGLHVWVALGTSNLGQVELPAFVREVIIAADADEPGLKAARDAGAAYRASGYQVRIVSPGEDGVDFNNLIVGLEDNGYTTGV